MNKGEVHLWTLPLAAPRSRVTELYSILSADEHMRVDALRFERDRQSFIVGRGLLRLILSYYLGRDPHEHAFEYGAKGKPQLTNSRAPTLHFNLAHSKGCAIFAITRDCNLGVDLEFVRDLPELEAISMGNFTPSECDHLFSIDPPLRTELFFKYWTCKEAYVKATGAGLSLPFDQLQVSFLSGKPPAFTRLERNEFAVSEWSLLPLVPAVGYVGALAVPLLKFVLVERTFARCEDFVAQCRMQ
jgi:4'-phosphopantetheinyl transferase